MKWYEVQPALEEGKKAYRSSWAPDRYIIFNLKEKTVEFYLYGGCDDDDHELYGCDLLADDWKILEDSRRKKLTFDEAVKALKDGKKVKAMGAEDYEYYTYDKNTNKVLLNGHHDSNLTLWVSWDGVLGGEWEVIEDVPEMKIFRATVGHCPHCGSLQLVNWDIDGIVTNCGNCRKPSKNVKKYDEIILDARVANVCGVQVIQIEKPLPVNDATCKIRVLIEENKVKFA